MGGTDHALATLSLEFQGAAIGTVEWSKALGSLASFTGSQHAELIGFGAKPFHMYSGLYDGALEDFAAAGGNDITVNSRIRIGLNSAELVSLDESSFFPARDCEKNRDYGEVIEKIDIPFVCLTTLRKRIDSQLGLAVMRSRKAGNISADQKRLFAAAAPHVLTAISTALVLESRALELARASLESLDVAAFIVDRAGRTQIWTPAGDDLLARGLFKLQGNRLCLGRGDDCIFQNAIVAASSVRGVDGRVPAPVLAYDESDLGYLVNVTPLPGFHGFEFDAAVLVIAKPPRNIDAFIAALSQQIFRLTLAEAAVAGLLASGSSASEIAERQGVRIGTVRTHIRRILDKSGSGSQAEFLASIASRL